MRINKYIAQSTGLSRRAADEAIKAGHVTINSHMAELGHEVKTGDTVTLNKTVIKPRIKTVTIMLNKPIGYVCSRKGQGSKTIYDLLPEKYSYLKPVGRLDKDSSGLILLTSDGKLANKLTHPKHQKEKVYNVTLNKTLAPSDKKKLLTGVRLSDGLSKFIGIKNCPKNTYEVTLKEGKNRQIRRTLNALGYKVLQLHRIRLGSYALPDRLLAGRWQKK